MARIPGRDDRQAGWLTRFAYRKIRRKIGRVITPLQIAAHHEPLFRGVLGMERAQANARTVTLGLKALAQLKVAMMIGCPF